MIKIVFAYAKSCYYPKPRYAFGLDGGLPWPHHPIDLKMFREVTDGCVMVMSKGTFESLPKLLPNRKHYVLTNNKKDAVSDVKCRSGEHPHELLYCQLKDYLDDFIVVAKLDQLISEDVCVIGGPKLITGVMPIADEVHATKISGAYKSDVEINLSKLKEYKKSGYFELIDKQVIRSSEYPKLTKYVYRATE
ncbi:putative dihydrofolate reductase [Vibrio phage vB_VmeM-32]|nr:putative dihydrofolate reductase [Vibrio phage vB_VmeM-32]